MVSNSAYEITWDKTDPSRNSLQYDPYSREGISDMKFSEFIDNIGSSDEEDDMTVIEGDGEEEGDDDGTMSEKKSMYQL